LGAEQIIIIIIFGDKENGIFLDFLKPSVNTADFAIFLEKT
jgi:hypothetical protein